MIFKVAMQMRTDQMAEVGTSLDLSEEVNPLLSVT